jgi:arsenite methyltransferase
MDSVKKDERIKEAVRETYGDLARRFVDEAVSSNAEGSDQAGCCGSSQPTDCCAPSEVAVEVSGAARFYSARELARLPKSVTGTSAGCGNPIAIAGLQPGEVVLDLGAGGGIDCFLAAARVGPEGRVIGLDMTPDMIRLARRNARKIGAANVEFRFGEMEDIPLPDESVDVIISNCVINLSPDKDAVFREAYRLLRPGGRMSVSDIVVSGRLPQSVRERLDAWAGCLAGALEESDYVSRIRGAGFADVEVVSQEYATAEEVAEAGVDVSGEDLAHTVASIRLTAFKPVRAEAWEDGATNE